METNKRTLFLVIGMLVTGTLNTILNKLQDKQCVKYCDKNLWERKYFEQPVWQTLNMFLGEFSCIIVYLYMKRSTQPSDSSLEDETLIASNSENHNRSLNEPIKPHNIIYDEPMQELEGSKMLLMWLPTMFDICGTTLMNVGLIYTSASIYQMLRGAIVIFVGLFSVIFLKRKLEKYQWMSLILIVVGVTIVGMSSIFKKEVKANTLNSSVIGVAMVLIAQMFSASQFVVEEKIMSRFTVSPVKAVWLEGFFGLLTVGIAMPIMHLIYGRKDNESYFNIINGYHEIFDHTPVWLIGIFIAISIGFFNMFGLSVTRTVSATSRSTIDTSRTVFIWIVSLSLGWEQFSFIQVIGFVILVYATFIFNNVIDPPSFLKEDHPPDVLLIPDECSPLIHESISP